MPRFLRAQVDRERKLVVNGTYPYQQGNCYFTLFWSKYHTPPDIDLTACYTFFINPGRNFSAVERKPFAVFKYVSIGAIGLPFCALTIRCVVNS